MITNENVGVEKIEDSPLFENGELLIEAHLKIIDVDTNEEIINMRG